GVRCDAMTPAVAWQEEERHIAEHPAHNHVARRPVRRLDAQLFDLGQPFDVVKPAPADHPKDVFAHVPNVLYMDLGPRGTRDPGAREASEDSPAEISRAEALEIRVLGLLRTAPSEAREKVDEELGDIDYIVGIAKKTLFYSRSRQRRWA